MKTVRQLLEIKGNRVLSTTPDASVYDALLIMAEMEVGALVIMDGDQVAGIFSERDYARNVVLKGKTSRETPVRDIMTSKVISVAPENTVEDCMNLMSDKRIRHLPVLDHGKIVGMLSIGDLVKETIAHQQFLISQLENYIKS
ncbi:histidine kinase [Novimethylophilus kurashikiensis]|uniref:Histidine kinase n=1 Tax=Novimethylophilus kurashikiensis TaxID=1825523 RepID=A0A2R5FB46_9PROT|nr:CBS domain-containing protein [Novimethylophilus kurashikiensis]GBG13911.1 histidine kinase [Novimethylophilus kurashikiensis]